MTVNVAADRDQLVEALQDAAMNLIDAASAAAAATTDLIGQAMTAAPQAAQATLQALDRLGAAQGAVLAAVAAVDVPGD